MMNEEMEQFEQRLSRQPLKGIPAEWRGEILSAAWEGRRVAVPEIGDANMASLPKLRDWLLAILWPHPRAWAGLAVVWILILTVDFSVRDTSQTVAGKSSPPSPQVITELRQQQRLLAELIGSRETHDADRTKPFVPQPRSEQRFEILTT